MFLLSQNVEAQELEQSAKLDSKITTTNIDDQNDALNDLVEEAELVTTSIVDRLNDLVTEFDRRQACHSLPDGGAHYTGDSCYVPTIVEDFYLQFRCHHDNFSQSSCAPGYVLRSASDTVQDEFWTGAFCDTYCKVEIGNICILLGAETRRYGFCVRAKPEQNLPVPN